MQGGGRRREAVQRRAAVSATLARMTQEQQLRKAERHLASIDPVMAEVIGATGPCRLGEDRPQPLPALVGAIVAQQISVHAARAIHGRLRRLLGGRFSARRILTASDQELRDAGLSPQKIRYLRDLAEKVAARRLRLSGLEDMGDDEVVEVLTGVKGIGVWTAQMFLIFRLGRLDVLPLDDLGLLEGARLLYELPARPDGASFARMAEPWRPYRSVGCWYLWQGRRLARGDELR